MPQGHEIELVVGGKTHVVEWASPTPPTKDQVRQLIRKVREGQPKKQPGLNIASLAQKLRQSPAGGVSAVGGAVSAINKGDALSDAYYKQFGKTLTPTERKRLQTTRAPGSNKTLAEQVLMLGDPESSYNKQASITIPKYLQGHVEGAIDAVGNVIGGSALTGVAGDDIDRRTKPGPEREKAYTELGRNLTDPINPLTTVSAALGGDVLAMGGMAAGYLPLVGAIRRIFGKVDDAAKMPGFVNPGKVAEAVEEAPKTATPKAAVPPKPKAAPQGQGITHEAVDELRSEMGWDLKARGTKPDTTLFKEAKRYAGKEAIVAQRVLADEKGKRVLSDSEGLALGSQLKALKQQMQDAKAASRVEDFDNLEAEAQVIADALDESGTRQGRAFRARQFLARDFDSWEFNRGVDKAAMDMPLSAKKQGYRARVAVEVDAATAALKAERDEAVQNYQLLLDAVKSKKSKGPMDATQQRNAALTSLRKLGIQIADDVPSTGPVSGGIKGKQSGTINIPPGSEEQVARHMRTLVRSYGSEGAKNWNDVLAGLKRDLPGIDEDQALFFISGKYRKAKIAANVAQKKAMAFMREVKLDAEYRTKNWLQKSGKLVSDVLNTASRSLQTTADDSLALIQMKNVLLTRPGTWFKGVGQSLKAGFRGNPIEYARQHKAKIEAHPLYPRAVQAKLALSEVDGAFSKQEEIFAGTLENKVPVLANSKAAATVIGNEIRFDLFRKMAANAPRGVSDDVLAAYYEDIARTINVFTGKGDGALAQWLASKPAGMVAYAPRMYLSRWQHNFLQPVWKAGSGAGAREAGKMYVAQALSYATLIYVGKELFGMDIDIDPRSATFGRAWAKDGSWSFDMFNNNTEGLRVATQFFMGRTSKGGNYTEPADFGSFGPGSYLESKMAPGAKTLNMLRTGQVYDDETGKFRDATGADFGRQYLPLSTQDMAKVRSRPALLPFQFFGAGADVKPRSTGNAPPMSWPPPGLKKVIGAN